MKIAYIGIDLFLPALEFLKKINCEVLEIFSCPTDNFTEFNTGIINFAKQYNIPYKLEKISENDFERLYNKGCEAVICAGYYYKIPVYKKIPSVNIHPSLLPYGRGSWPMPYEILLDNRKSGVTIHKISSALDEGDILLQRDFLLSENENHDTFMEKVYNLLPELLNKLILNFDKLYASATPQAGNVVYFPLPDKKMYTVNRDTDIITADKLFRAFYGYECYYNEDACSYILIRPYVVEDLNMINTKTHGIFNLKDGYAVCLKENIYKNDNLFS